jgi:DNA-binding protein H-NS
MQHSHLKRMSVEELWSLHAEVNEELARRIWLEKAKLEERLHRVRAVLGENEREHRPYPKVLAKYRNPTNPEETWAGRGKQPRWLAAQLRSGKKLDQFLIRRS